MMMLWVFIENDILADPVAMYFKRRVSYLAIHEAFTKRHTVLKRRSAADEKRSVVVFGVCLIHILVLKI